MTDDDKLAIERMAADHTSQEIALKLGLTKCEVGRYIGLRRRQAKEAVQQRKLLHINPRNHFVDSDDFDSFLDTH